MTPSRTEIILLTLLWAIMVAGLWSAVFPEVFFDPPSVVQDDGRHFVIWLRQLSDPSLFADDAIAEYFGAVTPVAYKILFFPANWLNIDPVTWQFMAIAPLSMALYLVAVTQVLRPIFDDAWQRVLSAQILALEFNDILIGLPRSFGISIVLFSVVFFMMGRRWALGVTMLIGANIYPVAGILSGVAIAVAQIWCWIEARTIDRESAKTLGLAACFGGLGLVIFLASSGGVGSALTLDEARSLPIFNEGGRTVFFRASMIETLLCDGRGGALPVCWPDHAYLAIFLTCLVLSIGLITLRRRNVNPTLGRVLFGLLIGGAGLFILAYLVAFSAHLPARYRAYSLDLILFLFLGIALVVGLRSLCNCFWVPLRPAMATFSTLLGAYFFTEVGPRASLRHDPLPELSAALRELPADTLVAGNLAYLDSVPSFTNRSVYLAAELAVSYNRTYYRLLESRATIQAHLLSGPVDEDWHTLLARSGIDVFVLETEPRILPNRLERSFPVLLSVLEDSIVVTHPNEAAACMIAHQGSTMSIDAACFAEMLLTSS